MAAQPRKPTPRRRAATAGASRRQPPRAKGRLFGLLVKATMAIAACSALVATVAWTDPMARLQEAANRPITGVTIEGEFKYLSQDKIQGLLSERVAGSFLQLDMVGLKVELEHNPWIDKVTISRQWPDRLVVRIQEQQPIARWGENAFVNMRGDIIEVESNSVLSHLPLLKGNDRYARDVMQKYVQIARLLAPTELTLQAVHLDETLSWTLQLRGGLTVRVGREQVYEKLQRLLDVYPRELAAKSERIASIDLRYGNGFAVAWKDAGLEQMVMANQK
jgi:cell division protein FtsQ